MTFLRALTLLSALHFTSGCLDFLAQKSSNRAEVSEKRLKPRSNIRWATAPIPAKSGGTVTIGDAEIDIAERTSDIDLTITMTRSAPNALEGFGVVLEGTKLSDPILIEAIELGGESLVGSERLMQPYRFRQVVRKPADEAYLTAVVVTDPGTDVQQQHAYASGMLQLTSLEGTKKMVASIDLQATHAIVQFFEVAALPENVSAVDSPIKSAATASGAVSQPPPESTTFDPDESILEAEDSVEEESGEPTAAPTASPTPSPTPIPEEPAQNALNGIEFTGTNYLSLGNQLTFERNSPFSISVWLKTNHNSGVGGAIFWLGSPSSPQKSLAVVTLVCTLRFVLSVTQWSNAVHNWSTASFCDNQWHHLVVTYNGNSSASGVKYYWDGVRDEALTPWADNLTSSIFASDQIGTIGAHGHDTAYLHGSLDEYALYNQELTPTDVGLAFAAGANLRSNTIPGKAPILLLNMNTPPSNHLDSVPDSSGNNRTVVYKTSFSE